MSNAYHVPTQILTSQAKITAKLYEEDSEENRQKLAGIGIIEQQVDTMVTLAEQIDAIEGSQEAVKNSTQTEVNEATAATRAIIDWRNIDVLPRVKIAFKGNRKLRHFRPGKLKSVRAATVIREGRLLADAIERFRDDPEMVKRGVTMTLAEKGRALLKAAEKEDGEAAAAVANQRVITEQVYEMEDQLDDILAEIERCAAAVFPPESATLKRYRLNVIREYITVMHNQSNSDDIIDPTVEAEVPDPVSDVA